MSRVTMNRFLLIKDALNGECTCFIVHKRSPLAIIYCDSKHGVGDNNRYFKEYEYKNITGAIECWTLSTNKLIDSKTGFRLLNRAWTWFYNYLESEKKTILAGGIMNEVFSPN